MLGASGRLAQLLEALKSAAPGLDRPSRKAGAARTRLSGQRLGALPCATSEQTGNYTRKALTQRNCKEPLEASALQFQLWDQRTGRMVVLWS